jgi:cytochrome c-type biogenesis protein CcmH
MRMRHAAATVALCAALALPLSAFAQKDLVFEQRLKTLEEELRCLVCQNQSLADSNAPLAEDLRREVRALADAGKNDQEIRDFLVARYGDFVLYKPPVKATTWLLWFGPFALLLGGGVVWWLILRRRTGPVATPAAVDDAAVEAGVERARALLDDPRS